MKSYKNHLTSIGFNNNYLLRKPIYRSSAIFPFLINKKMNTNIHFLGYWLIKRNIKEITLLITIRNKLGKIYKRFSKAVIEVKSYTINLKKEIGENNKKNFTGSIELEVFSTQDMVFPYPAFVVSFDGEESSSVVHTCGRVYNDHDDFIANNQFLVPETGFDISNNKDYLPFFSFVNGNTDLKNLKIVLELINSSGLKKRKSLIFKKINSFETVFVNFVDKDEKKFFNNEKGTVKIYHNFKSFFPRFLAGNFDKKKENSSITHTYYDLSKKKDETQYWKNPNKKKYFDSAIAVPLIFRDRMYTELAIYPNFSKIDFNLNLQIFDKNGNNLKNILDFLKIKENFNSPRYVNLNELITKNNIKLDKNQNYFCRLYTSSRKKILARLKFGLNIGTVNKFRKSIASNICFNAQVPVKDIYKKKGTFKWGLIKNNYNSQIFISNLGFLKKNFKKANIILKFWNEFNNNFLEKKITIPDKGSYFFYLNKNKKIKNFLKKNPGWVTIQSDNPFVNGWYLDISKNGSVGADHLF